MIKFVYKIMSVNLFRWIFIYIVGYCLATEKDVIFGVPQSMPVQYFGNSPIVKLSLNEANTVVAVQTFENNTIYTKVGHVKGLRIAWSDWVGFTGFGTVPSVSIDNFNNTIMTYELNGSLYYQTGSISDDSFIRWNKAVKYEEYGTAPFVALHGNDVLECHENRSVLYCKTCKLGISSTLANCQGAAPLANGTNVTVGLNSRRNAIDVHVHEHRLWYTVGVLDNTNNVIWGETAYFNHGNLASVVLNDENLVFLVWKNDQDEIHYSTGQLVAANKSVLWYKERKEDGQKGAEYLTVGANSDTAVLCSDKGFSTSLIRNRKRWMELTPGILNKSLWQVTLPGSHDAGAYNMMNYRVKGDCKQAPDWIPGFIIKQYSETQNENFQEQLENGVRYFDVRPYYWSSSEGGTNDFHVYHDNIGARISRILYLTKTYLESVDREFVILRFSHFCASNFVDTALHHRLSRSIRSILGDYILKQPIAGNLLTTPLGRLLEEGSRALVIYDHDFASDNVDLGFLRHRPYFNQYANTDQLSQMQEDQKMKLQINSGKPNRLFLLSYTLTWQQASFLGDAKNLHNLTRQASRTLADFVDELDDENFQINIIFVDFCSEARVTDVSIYANEKKLKREYFNKTFDSLR